MSPTRGRGVQPAGEGCSTAAAREDATPRVSIGSHFRCSTEAADRHAAGIGSGTARPTLVRTSC